MKIFFLIFLSLNLHAADFLSAKIINAEKIIQTSYSSSDFNGFIPNWVIDGVIYPATETKTLVLNKNKVACVTWVFDLSDGEDAPKNQITDTLFKNDMVIPNWKSINQKPHFVDPKTDYAFSFICIAKNQTTGEIEDTDIADFQNQFLGFYEFNFEL